MPSHPRSSYASRDVVQEFLILTARVSGATMHVNGALFTVGTAPLNIARRDEGSQTEGKSGAVTVAGAGDVGSAFPSGIRTEDRRVL